jgi:hypothetical protein
MRQSSSFPQLFLLSHNFIEITYAEPREIVLSAKVLQRIPHLLSQLGPQFTIYSSESELGVSHLDLHINVILTPQSNRNLDPIPPKQAKPPLFPLRSTETPCDVGITLRVLDIAIPGTDYQDGPA